MIVSDKGLEMGYDDAIGHLYPILNTPNLFSLPLDECPMPESPPRVPPSSRCDNLNFSPDAVPTLPSPVPQLKPDAVLPIVRERGVAESLQELAELFGMRTYNVNLIEYWFLDLIADCVWRVQDEFCLPNDMQRIIVAWVVYFLNLVKDTDKNFNKEEIFEILKETAELAGESMTEGDPWLPNPIDLADIMTVDDYYNFNQQEAKFGTNYENEEIDYVDLRKKDGRHVFVLEVQSRCSSSDLSSNTALSMTSCYDSADEDAEKFQIPISPRVSPNASTTYVSQKSMKSSKTDTIKRPKFPSDTRKVVADYRKYFKASSVTSLDSETAENIEIEQLSKRAMLAVFDCIFEFFDNEFQFYIIHAALTNPPNYIQHLIDHFHYPKRPYAVRAAAKPAKGGKAPSEPVAPPIVFRTSEEIAGLPWEEIKHIHAEQDAARYEATLTKTEEYKKFLYPLQEAVGEDFYVDIFEEHPGEIHHGQTPHDHHEQK